MSAKQRKQMIEPELREPSISRQCHLLSLSRSTFFKSVTRNPSALRTRLMSYASFTGFLSGAA